MSGTWVFREEVTIDEAKFTEDSGGVTGFVISGLALPFGKRSRNGVLYRKKSVEQTHKQLRGGPVLFNHNSMWISVGHVVNTKVENDGLHYIADINPEILIDGNKLVTSLERKDMSKVSISISPVEDTVKVSDDERELDVDVEYWNELSVVSVPGFPQTTVNPQKAMKDTMANLIEALKHRFDEDDDDDDDDDKPKKKKKKKKDDDDDDDQGCRPKKKKKKTSKQTVAQSSSEHEAENMADEEQDAGEGTENEEGEEGIKNLLTEILALQKKTLESLKTISEGMTAVVEHLSKSGEDEEEEAATDEEAEEEEATPQGRESFGVGAPLGDARKLNENITIKRLKRGT